MPKQKIVSEYFVRNPWILAVGLLLVIAAFFFNGIEWMNMRPDEELTYTFLQGDFLPAMQRGTDTHPPLWWAIFWVWMRLVGTSEFTGRIHAVYLTLLTFAMVYRIGRDWFRDTRFGLFAMTALAINAYFFAFTMEIRPYPLVLLLATVCIWAFQRWLRLQTRRSALWYSLSVTAMMYVHYHLAFLIIAQMIYFLLRRPGWQLIKQYVMAGALAFALWLPWLFVFIQQVTTVRSSVSGLSEWGTIRLGTAPTRPTSIVTLTQLLEFMSNGHVVLMMVVLLAGVILMWRKRENWLTLLWFILPITLVLLINLYAAIYTPRYISYVSVGVGIAAGIALAVIPSRLRIIVLLVFVVINLMTFKDYIPNRTPYRDIFRTVSASARADDAIFFDHAAVENSFVQLHVEQYLAPSLQENMVDSVEEAVQSRYIWYINGDWFNEDVRTTFSILGQTHSVQEVYGDCNHNWCLIAQLMEAPPEDAPIWFDEVIGFRGIDLEMIADDRLNLRLWWEVDETPDRDYSIGLHLLNADGSLVAQTDGAINDRYAGIVQMSQLEVERTYIDQRTLALPGNLPEGEYQLALLVYWWEDNSRLILEDGNDYLLLDTITISK